MAVATNGASSPSPGSYAPTQLGSALADVKFSRTVSDVKTGFSGSASLDSGCTSKVDWGLNENSLF